MTVLQVPVLLVYCFVIKARNVCVAVSSVNIASRNFKNGEIKKERANFTEGKNYVVCVKRSRHKIFQKTHIGIFSEENGKGVTLLDSFT